MAEYIGYEEESEFPIFGGKHPKFAVLTDTEIIRCRDCKHFRDVPMSDGSTGHRCSGVFTFVETAPDGFCAWAVRA